jgi:hypothetical protein
LDSWREGGERDTGAGHQCGHGLRAASDSAGGKDSQQPPPPELPISWHWVETQQPWTPMAMGAASEQLRLSTRASTGSQLPPQHSKSTMLPSVPQPRLCPQPRLPHQRPEPGELRQPPVLLSCKTLFCVGLCVWSLAPQPPSRTGATASPSLSFCPGSLLSLISC